MRWSRHLTHARRRAGLTQRALAERARVPQSTVGRIEAELMVPRVDTLERLLRVCGESLEPVARKPSGVDKSQIIERLRMKPRERLEEAVSAGRALTEFRRRARRR